MNEKMEQISKTVKEFLLGKQEDETALKPKRKRHPLEEMLEALIQIKDIDWYGYAFSRDPINGKFTEEQRKSWMEKAIICGREYANRVSREYESKDPKVIAEGMKMKVSYPELPEKTDRILFAEYRVPNRICIYMDAVNKAKRYLKRPEIRDLLTHELDVSKLLLAHELFHNVEDKHRKEIFTQREKARLWSLGPIHNDSPILALSEIAAMSFAKELTGIPYSPYVMDVFLMYGYSPEEASGLYEEMMEYVGMASA